MVDKRATTYNDGGIGFLGLLTILFVGLKLTGHITWSWYLVLLPAYIIPLVLLGGAAVIGCVVGLASLLSLLRRRKK